MLRYKSHSEYDVKIGVLTESGERINSHVWQRQYDKPLVVVNLPGAEAPYEIKLDKPAKDSPTDK